MLPSNSRGSFRMRSSIFRHIYGESYKRDSWYDNLSVGGSANEGTICSVNPQFLAFAATSSGGSSFVVHPLDATGRVDASVPKYLGHRSAVVDLKFNPFDDHVIASASDDATVRVWRVAAHGGSQNVTHSLASLQDHQRRVIQLEWHPAAENIMVTCGQDKAVYVWDVEHGRAVTAVGGHEDVLYSVAWNRNGSLLATTCRDRYLRLIDPRTGKCIESAECHKSSKSSRCTFIDDNSVLTTGVSASNDREFSIWQSNSLATGPLAREAMDASNGVIMPFYDPDTRLLFLAGKGDANIRFYELTKEAPFFYSVGQFSTSSPQQALGLMPKRGLDFHRCEIMRFYKLHAAAATCEPISIIVPRRFGVRPESVQKNIYPPFAAPRPALSSADWLSGVDLSPLLMNLDDLPALRSMESRSKLSNRSSSSSSVDQGESSPPKRSVMVAVTSHHRGTSSNCSATVKDDSEEFEAHKSRSRPPRYVSNAQASSHNDDQAALPPVAAFIRDSPFYTSLNAKASTLRSHRLAPTQLHRKHETGPVRVVPTVQHAQESTNSPRSRRSMHSSVQPTNANTTSAENGSLNAINSNIGGLASSSESQRSVSPTHRSLGAQSRKRTAVQGAGEIYAPENEVDLRIAYATQFAVARRLREEVEQRDRRIAELEAQLQCLQEKIGSSAVAKPKSKTKKTADASTNS